MLCNALPPKCRSDTVSPLENPMSHFNNSSDRSDVGLGLGLGLWGVLSGIAMFLTWDTSWRHEDRRLVAVELVVAVVVAWVTEWARERVEGHKRRSSLFTSIMILIVLEFFVLGFHGIPGLDEGHLRDVSRRILGEASEI